MKSPRRRRLAIGTARVVEAADGISAEAFTGHFAEVIRDKDRHIEKLEPDARVGARVRASPQFRKKDQAREAFLAAARNVLASEPTLDRETLVNHGRLAEYYREHGDMCYRWARELYPKRLPGRPRKEK